MSEQRPSGVVLSQVWAYGGRLFLPGSILIDDCGIPPRWDRICSLDERFTMLGIYAPDADAEALRACGFHAVRQFRDRGGRAVTVYRRGPGGLAGSQNGP
jgi:hypothetical protein